jgi:hypothetical protein
LNIPESCVGIEIDNGRCIIEEAGFHVLVESLDDHLETINEENMISMKLSKEIQVDVAGWGSRPKLTHKSLYLVHVETFHGAVAALPNIGGNKGEFIVIRPCADWYKSFSWFLNDI